jgi:hypothetical protein
MKINRNSLVIQNYLHWRKELRISENISWNIHQSSLSKHNHTDIFQIISQYLYWRINVNLKKLRPHLLQLPIYVLQPHGKSVRHMDGSSMIWSGRGGGGGGSCVGHVCRPAINLLHYCKVLLDYCIWIVIVVHSSLIIMLSLKLLYLILSLINFCFIMKNSTPPALPLARARGGCTPLHPPVNPSLVRHIISELKQAMFLSTQTSDCRGWPGLKNVFVSVCGNLQMVHDNF